jgi:hypothetical protein
METQFLATAMLLGALVIGCMVNADGSGSPRQLSDQPAEEILGWTD